jgi:hypothetical protein
MKTSLEKAADLDDQALQIIVRRRPDLEGKTLEEVPRNP